MSTPSSALHVAVVGAGPAGMYLAEALVEQSALCATVDLYDRLPTPFGLLRYGVAPDHLKMKSLTATLQRTLDHPRVRFFGNVQIGADIGVDDLRARYHAVVYALGTPADRRLDIPGEDLRGVAPAARFVNWYCGHPDGDADAFDLAQVQSAVVVGGGNVALDVTRVLAKNAEALSHTDIPDAILERLRASAVREIHVVARRGPAQAKFTAAELRELGELDGVAVVVDPHELVLTDDERSEVAVDPARARMLRVLADWAERPPRVAARTVRMHFRTRTTLAVGDSRLRQVQLESQGTRVGVDAGLLLRAVGYRGRPLTGVPFDAACGVVPNDRGRVLRNGRVSRGEYVVGWIGRGPVGVLGSNRADATRVTGHVLEDAPALLGSAPRSGGGAELVVDRGLAVVNGAGWKAIDAAEIASGVERGRARVKIATRTELLAAASHPS